MEKQFASIKTELQILTASGIAQALRSMHNPSQSPTLTTSFLPAVTPQSLPAVTPQSLPAVTVVTSQCPLAMGTSQAGSTLTSQQSPVRQFQSMPNSSTDANVPEPLEVCCMRVCCK